MAPPFTIPCEGHEAWFLHWESNPGPSRGSPLLYRNLVVTIVCWHKIVLVVFLQEDVDVPSVYHK